MPREPMIETMLVLCPGPAADGWAGQDCAGIRACLAALKEEGVEVVLAGPAAAMAEGDAAHRAYAGPLDVAAVAQVIQKERPDAILPTFAGQAGLDLAMALHEARILERYGVRLAGVGPAAIRRLKGSQGLKRCMESIGQPCVPSNVEGSAAGAVGFANGVGYPVTVRPAYPIGGTEGETAYDEPSLRELAGRGLRLSRVGQVLVERCITGWKEVELVVMRDRAGTAVQICSMERLEPVGFHAEGAMVAIPAQTLTDGELQTLRSAALDIAAALGVEGACHCRFALRPDSCEYVVTGVGLCLSSWSGLAARATGYPIAGTAARAALGLMLEDIPNACQEPELDYCALRVPGLSGGRPAAGDDGTGGAMVFAGSFEGALVTAARSLGPEIGGLRLDKLHALYTDELEARLAAADRERLFVAAEILRRGRSLQTVKALFPIDPWFLRCMQNTVEMEAALLRCKGAPDEETLRAAKGMCFTESYIGWLCGMERGQVKALGERYGLRPAFKQAGAGASRPYYDPGCGGEDEADGGSTGRKKVLVLCPGPAALDGDVGSMPLSVPIAQALRRQGYEPILVGSGLEAVSAGDDPAGRRYCVPLTVEDIQSVVEREQPWGAVVQLGGQAGGTLAQALMDMGVSVLDAPRGGMDPAGDRGRFEALLDACRLPRPERRTASGAEEVLAAAREIGYPVRVYPPGGREAWIARRDRDIIDSIQAVRDPGRDGPILVERCLMGREVEVDGVFDGEDVLIPGMIECVERAGAGAGDSVAVCPPVHIGKKQQEQVERYARSLAKAMGAVGPFRIRSMVCGGQVYTIEAVPRFSSAVPYLSKATGVPIIDLAVRAMLGEKLKDMGCGTGLCPETGRFAVKMPVFSVEGPAEGASASDMAPAPSGQVLGVAGSYPQALLKAFRCAGMRMPRKGGRAIVAARDGDWEGWVVAARRFVDLGVEVLATDGLRQALLKAGVPCSLVAHVSEAHPDVLDMIASGTVDFVAAAPADSCVQDGDSVRIRRAAAEHHVGCVTYADTVQALLTAWEQEGEPRGPRAPPTSKKGKWR